MEKPRQDNNCEARYSDGIFSGPADGRHVMQRMPGEPWRHDGENMQCRQCILNNKKNNTNTPLVIVAVTSIVVLLIAFLATLFCLIHVVMRVEKLEQNAKDSYKSQSEAAPEKIPDTNNGGANPEMTIPKKQESENAAGAAGEYYGDVTDNIRTDLDYSIKWENYEYEGNNEYVMIAVDYPVIEGDVPNRDILNEMIANEVVYFEEYFNEYSQYMLDGEIFVVYSEGNVTYMDEEKMSIVFTETIYSDYWQDTDLYCINIDMENGVVLNNSSILEVNKDFAVDFRIRSREQNGSVSALDYMTDQEMIYYLSNNDTSIIFYTPLGMEVGINYGESYVTVTYKDYEEFLQKY